MCNDCINRKPIKIMRRSITVATDNDWSIGNWFAFPRPEGETPQFINLKHNQRVLWCPWCDNYEIFQKDSQDNRWLCTGICGFGNTNEFYTRKYNNLWFEDKEKRVKSKK